MEFVEIELTQGNINNNHLYLSSVLEFFHQTLSEAATRVVLLRESSKFTAASHHQFVLTSQVIRKFFAAGLG